MALLELKDVNVKRANSLVLSGIDLKVYAEDSVSIIGPNGSGKSTLLKTCLKLLKYSGQLKLVGRPLEDYSQKELARLVSYVPQTMEAGFDLSVLQFVSLALYSQTQATNSKVIETIELCGLVHLIERKVAALSGGERQRVLIAAALAQSPRLLLLDEPTTFLDPHAEEEILELMALVRAKQKLTLVLVTHNLSLALHETKRIVALREGELVFDMPTAEVDRKFIKEVVFHRRPFQNPNKHYVM